jgi:hypothetical protein
MKRVFTCPELESSYASMQTDARFRSKAPRTSSGLQQEETALPRDWNLKSKNNLTLGIKD